MTLPHFHEAALGELPMRQLGLSIRGSQLEPILDDFRAELSAAGLDAVTPRFYLSTEWGVPFKTVAVAIPFYLAHPELAALHRSRTGWLEGEDRADILRYLRHEFGHVVNYAYVLYERPDWIACFGAMTQPYEEHYLPQPWSTRFVRHLPGWYAQKHPDEDWAETFAVWLTPGLDWRKEYEHWPKALAKLELCDRLMRELRGVPPTVTSDALDESLDELDYPIKSLYRPEAPGQEAWPPGLDGALRSIFAGRAEPSAEPLDASELIDTYHGDLVRAVYTWSGHFPEQVGPLLHHMSARANELSLVYSAGQERVLLIDLAALVTSLAMNHVQRGSYLP